MPAGVGYFRLTPAGTEAAQVRYCRRRRLDARGVLGSLGRIVVDLEQCRERPCIWGHVRSRVGHPHLFATGLTAEQILEELPDLELEDIQASLTFAAY